MFVPDIAANGLYTRVISQTVHTRPNGVQTGHSASVRVDPDSGLSSDGRTSFRSVLGENGGVFDPDCAGGDGRVGPFEAVVNMGPVRPPRRRGRLPRCARGRLVGLRAGFGGLGTVGVFVRPGDVPMGVGCLGQWWSPIGHSVL